MIFKKIVNTDFSQGERTPAKNIALGLLGLLSLIYLINPTAGFFELIPDVLPFVGNIDEFGATMILLNSLKYFGFDIMKIFNGDKKTDTGIKTEKVSDQPIYKAPEK
jgi:uncharacterized membrane protein YkvA (DUF1232 family)